MLPLALHQLTALDATPLELVSLAAANNCQRIVTWVYNSLPPRNAWPKYDFPCITPSTKADMKRSLSDNGIELANIEMFPISEDVNLESYRPYLELGAELNAARAVVHVHDLDENRAVDNLRKFCEIAAEYKLGAGIEFMGLIQGCRTLERGVFFAKAVDMPNVGVALDFLHVVRTGATAEDIRNVPAKYISYSQICDGPTMEITDSYQAEGVNRLAPGDGVWPLKELMEAVPKATAFDIEVPLTTLKDQGVPVGERVAKAAAAARALVESVNFER